MLGELIVEKHAEVFVQLLVGAIDQEIVELMAEQPVEVIDEAIDDLVRVYGVLLPEFDELDAQSDRLLDA